MQSLILANRRHERERLQQLMSKVAHDFQRASHEGMPLAHRYLLSIQNMKLRLRSLQLSMGITGGRKLLFSRSSESFANLRSSAEAFAPKLVSESSSDYSTPIDLSDANSDSDAESTPGPTIVCSPECNFDFDYTENHRLLEARKKSLLGRTVIGRLNVFVPTIGATRYYLNWSKNKTDNVRISPAVMKQFSALELVKSGIRLQCTITGVGPDYVRWDKQHPYTECVRHAPRTRSRGRSYGHRRSRH
jgi:hypothetical protein